VELVDLRDYSLPFFDEPVTPSMFEITKHVYQNDMAIRWTNKIAEADGFIFVTAEYNHGYPAVLKNALDYGYKEWKKKVAGFISYGTAGGVRAVEQLRQVIIELQMVPIKAAITIPREVFLATQKESIPINPDLFKSLREGRVDRVEYFFNELIWMTKIMKRAREEDKSS